MRRMSRMASAAIAVAALGLLVAPVMATQETGPPTDQIVILDTGSVLTASAEDLLAPMDVGISAIAQSSSDENIATTDANLATMARTAVGNEKATGGGVGQVAIYIDSGGTVQFFPLKSGPSAKASGYSGLSGMASDDFFEGLTMSDQQTRIAEDAFDTFDSAGVPPDIMAANATTWPTAATTQNVLRAILGS